MKKIFFILAVLLPLFVFAGCSKDDDEESNNPLNGTAWVYSNHIEVVGTKVDFIYSIYFSEATYKMTLTTDVITESPGFVIDDSYEEEMGSYTIDYPHVYLATNEYSYNCLLVDDKFILYHEDGSEMVFLKQK